MSSIVISHQLLCVTVFSGFSITAADIEFGYDGQDTKAMATTLAVVYDGIIRDALDSARFL